MRNKQTEIEFGTQFISSGSLSKITKNPYHIREFETLNGIPDLVLISGSKLGGVREFEKKYPRITTTSGTARLLSVLNKRSYRTKEHLSILTGLSESYVAKILNDLLRAGAVETQQKRGYRVARDFDLPSPRIISIEFKLDDWQKALVQATRHSAFAANSYVIMPADKQLLLKKNVERFMLFGISVATFDSETNQFEMIWKAPSNYRGRSPKSRISYLDSIYRMLNSIDKLEVIST